MHDYWQSLIPDYITDDLSETENHALEAHLKHCPECRQVLDEWQVIANVTKAKTKARNRPLPPLQEILDGTNHSQSHLINNVSKGDKPMTTLRIPQQKSYRIPWTAVAVLLITFFFSLLLLGGLELEPVPIQQGQGLGNIPEDPVELFKLYIDEIWNKQNLDAIPLLLSENHVHHDVSMSQSRLLIGIETTENYLMSETIVGLEAMKEYVTFEQDILPDVVFTAEGLVTNGNTISGRVKMRYENFETAVPVSATISDGKLTETWFDVGTMTEAYNLDLYSRFWNVVDSHEQVQAADLSPFIATIFPWHNPSGTDVANISLTTGATTINTIKNACRHWRGERTLMVQGDLVLSQAVGSCMFDRPLTWWMLVLPPNIKVDGDTVWMWRVENGKLVENWWYLDEPWYWGTIVDHLTTPKAFKGDEQIRAVFEANSPLEQNRVLAQRYVDEIWNAEELDTAVLEELYAPNVRFGYNAISPTRLEQTPMIELHAAIRNAFPDGQMDAQQIIADSANISIQFTWTGTQTGTFEYGDIVLPPSNDVLTTNGVIVLSMTSSGIINRETWYANFPFLAELEQITSR